MSRYLPSNIDYSQFDHIPRVERDPFYGIEKGYENFIVDWDRQEQPDERNDKVPALPQLQSVNFTNRQLEFGMTWPTLE